jgi:hypothetical protein
MLSLIGILIELFVLSYRLSFITILGYLSTIYWLFLGYYNENTITYILLYIVLTIFLDGAYIILNLFTTLILQPIIYSKNNFFNILAMTLIAASIILRLIMLKYLFGFKVIPTKNLFYFNFWG